MEIDLENMIMSEEQAHLFAVDIYNEVVQYFKELDEFWNKAYSYLEELAYKVVLNVAGSITLQEGSYQYSLCNYSRMA